MQLEVFKEIVDKLNEQSKVLDKTHEAGIDLTNLIDPAQSAITHLIGSIYGKEGLDIFDWWCYEKEWGTREDITMTDKDGNELCKTIEDLHAWLEDHAADDYKLAKKLTDEERLVIVKEIFGGL